MKTKITLAFIEPHLLMRQGIIYLLADQKHLQVVFDAENCWQLLEFLSHTIPDIIMVSTEMPELREAKLLKGILDEHPEVKVITLSDELNDMCIVDLIELGVKAILFNTCEISNVIHAIEEVHRKGFYYDPEIITAVERQIQKSTGGYIKITKREREVLNLLISGNTTKEAAEKLCISKRTVEVHRQSIVKKTGIKNLVALREWSAQHLN